MSASGLPRVALVHDWLTGMRGGEAVLEAIAELFPSAELFTLLYVPGKISPILTTLKRHVSALQKVPGVEKRYRHFLPLMPKLIERFDLTGFDLVISSSHCVAKGVRKAPGAVHVSYVHAPMRYMWDRFDDYFGPGRTWLPVRLAARAARPRLQAWDRRVSRRDRVDRIVANSRYIAEQVQRAYGRDADAVVYPFADTRRFTRPRAPGRNYLVVGAFAPYKRVDLIVEAFNRLKLPLMIVGSGQDAERVRRGAGANIEFLGHLSNAAIEDLYARCRAFVFAGKEDFGITPLEAMAAGAPVVAFGEGGLAETVVDGRTGLLFREQTVDSLCAAVARVEAGAPGGDGSAASSGTMVSRVAETPFRADEAACRARAAEFSRERFQRELTAVIEGAWRASGRDPAPLAELLKRRW